MKPDTRYTRTPLRPDTTGGGNRRSHGRVADGWLEMPWSIRILRAFLGGTFVFAGMQKFLDPNFLRVGGGDYIGTQLAGFANGTPAAPLMRILEHAPVLTGIAVAVLEIAVGLGTLAGVGMLAATSVGFAINTTLWLSATWHTHPYFLGSDSIYAVAWLALAAGVVEVEHAHRGHVAGPIERIEGISRREFVRGTLVVGSPLSLGSRQLRSRARRLHQASPRSPIGRPEEEARRPDRDRRPRHRRALRRSVRARPARSSPPSTVFRSAKPSALPIRTWGLRSFCDWGTMTWSPTADPAPTRDAWLATIRAPRSSCVRATGPSSIRHIRRRRSRGRRGRRSRRSRYRRASTGDVVLPI